MVQESYSAGVCVIVDRAGLHGPQASAQSAGDRRGQRGRQPAASAVFVRANKPAVLDSQSGATRTL